MKRSSIIILLTILMSMVSTKASAHDIAVKNEDGVKIYYEWIKNETELAVCYPGDYTKYSGDVVIPRSVKYYSLTYPVTRIYSGAFEKCKDLTSITIPNSVTSIGYAAFSGCSNLTSVYITDLEAWCNIEFSYDEYDSSNPLSYAHKLFLNGTEIKDLVIPNSVTSIGNSTFSGCSSLASITIPNSVTSIGYSAFSGCSGLTSVAIPNSVTDIGNRAFSGCSGLTSITIPNGVTSIGHYAFSGCSGLTSVTIPNSVTFIGVEAFLGCSGLTSITIPNSVTSIRNYTFYGCSGLTSVNIPNSVTTIGDYAFKGCSSLTSITIPNGVTDIGKSAFMDCSGLNSITIPYSVTTIGNEAFKGCSDQLSLEIHCKNIGSWFTELSSIKEIEIGDDVESIGSSAFQGCSGLTTINIPSNVTSIGDNAFSNCSGLNSITISNGVESIGQSAFQGCSSLISITIPSSVTSIGISAFEGCNSLTSITISNGVKSIGNDAFKGCSDQLSLELHCKNIGSWFSGLSYIKTIVIGDEVESIGGSAFSSCSGLTSVTIGNGVKNIGYKAFYGCNSLTSITIPNSVTSIGNSAFAGCSSLFSIELHCKDVGSWFSGLTSINTIFMGDEVVSINNEAFKGCSSLTSLTIGNNVTSIGYSAFEDCSSLTSVSIPNGVTSIGRKGFYNCSNLESVTIPNSVTSIGTNAFSGTKWYNNLSDGVIYVGNILYEYKGTMPDNTEIVIKEGTVSINPDVFTGRSSLKSITIPGSLAYIDYQAFKNCSALESVTIQEGVTSIGSSAFENCGNLSSLTIPSSVTSIGTKAFFYEIDASTVEWGGQKSRHLQVNISNLAAWCNIDFGNSVFNEVDYYYDKNEQSAMRALAALQRYSLCMNGQNIGELEIPKDVTEIKKNAFAYCRTTIKLHDGITIIGDNAFRFGYVSTSSGFKGVKRIGDYAFEYSNLSSIEFGEGLTSIGKYALSNTQIQSIVLPSTIESLGNLVFLECKRLSNVVLPNSLKSLPNGAFENCTSLKMMRLPNSLTSMGNGVFFGCSNMEYLIFTSESLPSFTSLSDQTFQVIMPQAAYEKGIPDCVKNFTTYNSEPMFVELKSKGATSAVFDVYPINDDGSLDEKNMATVTTVGQTPGQYLNWKLDKDNYGIISEKANETVTLTVQEPKVLSTIKARLLATTEEADDFEHYGFEWRQYDAPEGRPSNKVSAPLYNGCIVGTLNNLNPDKDYKYRPYYKSNDGTMFYGEWIWLFTGDADVFFEPEVYTKDAEDITKVSALLAGVWLEGTDDIEEKGFEYWTVSGSKTRAVGSDVKKVAVSGSGNAMTTTLEGLKSGATYGFRSYLKTTKGCTTYGEEKTFKTILIGDVNGDGELTNADADAIAKHIIGKTPTGFNKKMADVNEDEVVNVADIVVLINIIE